MQTSAFPKRIVIELTPRCNLSCPMCPGQYMQQMEGYMSGTLWDKLINEISDTSPDSIVLPFWRGESLLHPEFEKLITYALDKSMKIHISTNGHNLSSKHHDILARCEFVTFSVHSTIGYEHAKQFLTVRKGGNPVVQLSFVTGERTTEKLLPSLITSPDLNGFDSIRLYEEHTKEGQFGKSSDTLTTSSRHFCKKLNNTLVIAYDGTISRCNHIWDTDNTINLNDMSIAEAWSSQALKTIRDSYPDSTCGKCDQWIGHTLGESWRIVDGKVQHRVFQLDGLYAEN